MIYYLPSLTVLLIFACLVSYQYIQDLRRELKSRRDSEKTAWKLYDAASRELSTIRGTPAFDPYAPEEQRERSNTTSSPWIPTGIGPTQINDRELRREMDEQKKDYTPAPPENSQGRHPTPEQIAAAAREAAGNHGGRR